MAGFSLVLRTFWRVILPTAVFGGLFGACRAILPPWLFWGIWGAFIASAFTLCALMQRDIRRMQREAADAQRKAAEAFGEVQEMMAEQGKMLNDWIAGLGRPRGAPKMDPPSIN